MKRSLSLALLVSAFASASAQDTTRVGIGTTFNRSGFQLISEEPVMAQIASTDVLVPIRLRRFTWEPEIGFSRIKQEREVQTGPTTFTKVENSQSSFRLGLGFLKHMDARENLEPYFGPRIGYQRTSIEEESAFGGGSIKASLDSWFVAGVLGGQ